MGPQVGDTSSPEQALEGDRLIEVDEQLQRAVGCSWPVFMTRRVAELVTLTEENEARGERRDSRPRDLLWLAGIALSEMDAHDRVAPFDMVLAGKAARLEACFDTTDDLALQIIVARAADWGRGGDARGPWQRRSDR